MAKFTSANIYQKHSGYELRIYRPGVATEEHCFTNMVDLLAWLKVFLAGEEASVEDAADA